MLRGLRKKIFSVIMAAGIILLAVGFVNEKVYNKFLENSDPTTGVISRIDEEDKRFLSNDPTVYVTYTVDRTKIGDAIKDLTDFDFLDNLVDSATKKISIETKLRYYDESMKVGDNVYLIYNTKAPKKVYIDAERTVLSEGSVPEEGFFTTDKELDQVHKSAYYKCGLILFCGTLVLDIADSIITKRRQEKKMEKRIEKKMKKEDARNSGKK